MTTHNDLLEARAALESASGTIIYYQLESLTKWGVQGLERLPFTVIGHPFQLSLRACNDSVADWT